MTTTAAEISAKIRDLTADEKVLLIRTLIAELDGPSDTDVEATWVKEAQRRYQEIAEGRVQPIPAEQVFENLRRRLKR